jgi:hypothetical protein
MPRHVLYLPVLICFLFGCASAPPSPSPPGDCLARGLEAEARGDERAASARYGACCEAGDAASCGALGALRLRGQSPDLAAALPLLERACAAGEGSSCNELGLVALEGLGGAAPDPALALARFEAACAGGEPRGCHNAGAALLQGRGVAADEGRALALLGRGCAAGAAVDCFLVGITQERRGRWEEAAGALRRACGLGLPQGCLNLANLALHPEAGIGRPEEARALYRALCEEGFAEGCYNLGGLAWQGAGGEGPDRAGAARWWGRACALSLPEGCARLEAACREAPLPGCP